MLRAKKPGFFRDTSQGRIVGEKPGFYEFLRLVTRNIRRNPVSEVDRAIETN